MDSCENNIILLNTRISDIEVNLNLGGGGLL